jgi:uncharacterized membrane protein HdeD (DUF308 family)
VFVRNGYERGKPVSWSVILFLLALAICGGIATLIGHFKHRNTVESFAFGFYLGVIGVIVVACLPKQPPKGPPGS